MEFILTGFKARLPEAKVRPSELSRWLQTRKYDNVPELECWSSFANQWMVWWSALQPDWRPSKRRGGLPVAFQKNESRRLSGLRKGGPNGLVTVLIGLKWWKACEDAPWAAAVNDVRECIGVQVKREGVTILIGFKRVQNDESRTSGCNVSAQS